GIYPEGTRSRDGRLYRGRTGVGWLALSTGVPVIPVGLIGTDRLQPPGKNVILPRKFEIRVGEPIEVEHLGPKHGLQIRRKTTDRIMEKISELTGQERVDEYNKMPDQTASYQRKETRNLWLIQPHTGQKRQTFPRIRACTVSKIHTAELSTWVKPITSVPV